MVKIPHILYASSMIQVFYERLDVQYPREIGFIEAGTPYEHLIAVIMSAQTTDRQVNLVTPELFRRYPGPEDLAGASAGDVEEIIHSVGFYRVKAKNIIAAASVIHHEFRDEVPHCFSQLLGIPGVGRKSANVIRGACFGKPAVIVDTHFARVVRRFGLVSASNPDIIEREIGEMLEEKYQYRFSMTVNMHGRQVCHAKKPLCAQCIVEDVCRKQGLPEAFQFGDGK